MSETPPPQPPGWYHADGDPPGSQRYWNGAAWVGEPRDMGAAPTAGGGLYGGAPLAEPSTRIIARIIDLIIGTILFLVILGAIFGSGANDSFGFDGGINWGFTIVSVLVAFAWEAGFVHLMGGTPGKQIMGIRVARLDDQVTPPGQDASVKRALNRLLGIIPGLGSIIALIIGVVSLVYLFQDERRTVMDRVAGTIVIKKP
ncbi:MAG: RDD family protein [Actinomycetia bacterium]|nr:RDD family protein [Actinomycetes bacterium]